MLHLLMTPFGTVDYRSLAAKLLYFTPPNRTGLEDIFARFCIFFIPLCTTSEVFAIKQTKNHSFNEIEPTFNRFPT
jgi:hypothetical protein